MSRLDPAVARIRNAVRSALDQTRPALTLVACSGGADSLALAAAAAFVGPRHGWRIGLITVDHGLQQGSSARAAAVARWGSAAGLDPSEAVTVSVGRSGGPEAAAREARYGALVSFAVARGADCVLLGHTEDDQAETVLLALARGAGPRGLAAMPFLRARDGIRFVRPLLEISRAECRNACAAMELTVWEDPHNVDPAYARSRVRADVMPVLADSLGADVAPNLARSAAMIAADSTYLDELASVALGQCVAEDGLDVAVAATLPGPIRSRVLHAWAVSLGVPRAALSHRHVAALDALIADWHGQAATQLPGGISVARRDGKLRA